jgi:hypothetical protein
VAAIVMGEALDFPLVRRESKEGNGTVVEEDVSILEEGNETDDVLYTEDYYDSEEEEEEEESKSSGDGIDHTEDSSAVMVNATANTTKFAMESLVTANSTSEMSVVTTTLTNSTNHLQNITTDNPDLRVSMSVDAVTVEDASESKSLDQTIPISSESIQTPDDRTDNTEESDQSVR